MNSYKSIFISDVHLGSRGCQAEHLVEFLQQSTCDNLFLVGDIIDLWALERKFYFPQSHVNVIRHVMKCAKLGTKVTYIIGNHDERLREHLPLKFGDIDLVNEIVYPALDGRHILVTHGDDYDQIVKHAKWMAKLGDVAYHSLMIANRWVVAARRHLGRSHWSLSAFVKHKVKGAANFIAGFEETVARDIKDRGLDGVICGHIHHAEMRDIAGVSYMNDGDWVESCTALVEHHDGRFEIVRPLHTQV